MKAFSPIDAALEGLRVARREPKAVLGWIGVWLVALIVVAAVTMVTAGQVEPVVPGGHRGANLLMLVRRFGPLWPISVTALIVLWAMTTTTVYRAVLRPQEHGWHLFKLSLDEARIVAVTAAGFLVVLLLGAAPAYLLLVLLNPLMEAAPALRGILVLAGALATVAIDLWIAVRLWLMPVQTFDEGNLRLERYWTRTRGHFWDLALTFLLVTVELFAFLSLLALLLVGFGALAKVAFAPSSGGLPARVLSVALVVLGASLEALLFVVPTIVICACQAYAYRAIERPGDTAIVPRA